MPLAQVVVSYEIRRTAIIDTIRHFATQHANDTSFSADRLV
jgi:hypothetical protein